jgi:hypothetical protein
MDTNKRNPKKVKWVNFVIPSYMYEQLKTKAYSEGFSVSSLMKSLVISYLNNNISGSK